jgi:hypothetical protein
MKPPLEVYIEVFPDDPHTGQEAHEGTRPLIEQLADHINSGLEIDEVMDLWGLIFPKHRNVGYEEEERIHYNEEAEAVCAAATGPSTGSSVNSC